MTLITYPFHYLYFENFYSEEELKLIWEEIDRLSTEDNLLLSPEETGSAEVDIGSETKILKANKGVWLNGLHPDRKITNILNITRKLYEPRFISPQSSWFFKDINFNRDVTLLSYYEDGDHYLKHNDCSYITACTWLYKEPKQFLGGEFCFSDYDIKISCKNNSCIVFPSNIWHSVNKVYIPDEFKNKGLGRYCITQFVSVNIGQPDELI